MPVEADFSDAVEYHYGQFPPQNIDYEILTSSLADAAAALARFDVLLHQMHNSEILLDALSKKEAVISSRMEGTVTTLEEVLQYEADQNEDEEEAGRVHRQEAMEVYSYSMAMRLAERQMSDGQPISEHLIRTAHRMLLRFGRGAHLQPGEFKDEQNYLADRARRKILFVPITPEQLLPALSDLMRYIANGDHHPIIRAAIAHIEFEALHPFKDGNGRMGRILIPLQLWKDNQISAPHFYVSSFFEDNRDEYIDRMRQVSETGDWTQWVEFFLVGLKIQAESSVQTMNEIQALFQDMATVFRDTLGSKHYMAALEFMFASPVFRNNRFTDRAGIPRATAARFTRVLTQEGILRTIQQSSGRRAALLAFDPLLRLVRA